MYWTTKILFNVPVFNLLMTRNKFQLILKFLHFLDNSNLPARDDPSYDRLYKIRPVIDHLFEKFQSVYEPRRSICVDTYCGKAGCFSGNTYHSNVHDLGSKYTCAVNQMVE